MHSVYQALIQERIDSFRQSFLHASRQAFIDPGTGNLRHPGEFGSFREEIVRDFLTIGVPADLQIGHGFLINSAGETSTQIDVVLFDPKIMPKIESAERQRFFFVEGVVGIGEVKSRLTKPQLREALNKLARAKAITEQLSTNTVVRRQKEFQKFDFDRKKYPWDQAVSFLICESLDFDYEELVADLPAMYDPDISPRHRHNLILSVNDGVALYFDEIANIRISYPVGVGDLRTKNLLVKATSDSSRHIGYFASTLFVLLSVAPTLDAEMALYAPPGETAEHIREV